MHKHDDVEGREALSIKGACHVAGIGETTLDEAIRRGDLIARHCGRRVLILRSDLMGWLNALPRVEVPAV